MLSLEFILHRHPQTYSFDYSDNDFAHLFWSVGVAQQRVAGTGHVQWQLMQSEIDRTVIAGTTSQKKSCHLFYKQCATSAGSRFLRQISCSRNSFSKGD